MEDSSNKRYLDELIELEFDEDSVVYYIVDKNDNEIGVCLQEGDKQVEYLYDEDQNHPLVANQEVSDNGNNNAISQNPPEGFQESLKKTKEQLSGVTKDTKEIAQGFREAAQELNDAYTDLVDAIKLPKIPGIGKKFKKGD